jgi:hypothetical protein
MLHVNTNFSLFTQASQILIQLEYNAQETYLNIHKLTSLISNWKTNKRNPSGSLMYSGLTFLVVRFPAIS